MRVCDRHPRTRADDEIIFKTTDIRYDLCAECRMKIEDWIGSGKDDIDPPRKRSILGLKKAG